MIRAEQRFRQVNTEDGPARIGPDECNGAPVGLSDFSSDRQAKSTAARLGRLDKKCKQMFTRDVWQTGAIVGDICPNSDQREMSLNIHDTGILRRRRDQSDNPIFMASHRSKRIPHPIEIERLLEVECFFHLRQPVWPQNEHAAARTAIERAVPEEGSDNPETEPVASAAKAPPVTGVSGNALSKKVLDQFITVQRAGAAKTDKFDGDLNDIDLCSLDKIARAPVYAAGEAGLSGTSRRALWITYDDLGLNSRDHINQHPHALQKL